MPSETLYCAKRTPDTPCGSQHAPLAPAIILSPRMTKRFGSAPPDGGRTLAVAELMIPITRYREVSAEHRRVWDYRYQLISEVHEETDGISGKRDPTAAWEGARQSELTKALRDATHMSLLAGELRAVAIELGAIGAEYIEVLPIHWSELQICDWKRSVVRRYGQFQSPLFYVLVYTQDVYEKAIGPNIEIAHGTSETRTTGDTVGRRKTLKETIRALFDAATPEIRRTWQSKADATRWVCSQIPGRGTDNHATRYVIEILKKELAELFPDAPDGKTEK
jgi:hypothetical protein